MDRLDSHRSQPLRLFPIEKLHQQRQEYLTLSHLQSNHTHVRRGGGVNLQNIVTVL